MVTIIQAEKPKPKASETQSGMLHSDKLSTTVRKRRGEECSACKSEDCQLCSSCKDMKEYGGPGTKKQCCVKRRCLRK